MELGHNIKQVKPVSIKELRCNLNPTRVYVKLLNEGSVAYRPVSAYIIKKNIYKIDGSECYNPEDEEWEFLPNTCVLVEEKNLSGENVLVAIKEAIEPDAPSAQV